tara:strand:- start:1735 stop:2319 length:585 start_codon:yes stop_codon:yes gene_type:complete
MSLLILLVIGLFVTGCSTVNQVSLDKDTIKANATTASVIRNQDGSGVSQASQAASQLKDDDILLTTAGTGSMLSIKKGDVLVRAWLPKDAKIKNLKFLKGADGSPELNIEELVVTGSTVIDAADDQVDKALDTQGSMTDVEAEARKDVAGKAVEAAKDIVKSVGDAVDTDVSIGTGDSEPAPESSTATKPESTE